jgi:hypothetical protein
VEHNQTPGAGWPAPAVTAGGVAVGPGTDPGVLFPPPPPPPVGRGSRRWIPWAVAIGVTATVVGAVVIPKMVSAASGPLRGANAYLGLVRDGQTAAAYDSLCSEFRQATTPADYAAALDAEADQAGRLLSFNVYHSMVEIGGNSGLVKFKGHTSKGNFAMEARMMHEDGQWRWCGSRPQPKEAGITVHYP